MTRSLFLLLAASLALSVGFAVATPFGAAPDESAHLEYVRVLAEEHRLPRLDLTRPRDSAAGDISYEAHQPPLYYLAATPFYTIGEAVAGLPGARWAARFWSMLLGLLGVALIWKLARVVAPNDPALAWAAAGFAALLPMRLSIVSSVSNDALAEVTATACLLAMVLPLGRSATVRDGVTLGVLLGVAMLSKSSAITLLPAALIALAFWMRAEAQPAQTRAFLVQFGLVFGLALLICGPWLFRNHVLYGDPLGRQAFTWYFQDTPRWEDFKARLSFMQYMGTLVLPVTFDSFWGAFGHLSPKEWFLFMGALKPGYPPPSWLYPILGGVSLVSLAGLARVCLAARPLPQRALQVGMLFGLYWLLVVAAFLNFNSEFFQAQGRYLFPALGPITISMTGGWLAWASPSWRNRAAWIVVALMMILAVYALVGVVEPGFRRLAMAGGGPCA